MAQPALTTHPRAFVPIVAGIVTAVVGFSSSFAVVLTGLVHVGADAGQAASGLIVLCLVMGLGCIVFALRWRRPITMAWSTPGAALLVTVPAPKQGFAVAVGAFALAGALIAATGLVPALARLVTKVPHAVANGMLAGVLLSLCADAFRALHTSPAAVGCVIAAWALMTVVAPRWAVPTALLAALAAVTVAGSWSSVGAAHLAPALTWTSPQFSWTSVVAIALPLYLVTMTSQNIPGVSVMKSLGYEVPFQPAMIFTGLGTAVCAPFGGHAVNLSAIAATLAAGPDAGPDRSTRWMAAVSAGTCYMALGLLSPIVVAVARAAPAGLFVALAGVALLGSLGSALEQATASAADRIAGVTAVVVAVSGLEIAKIGAAFWALVAGCVLYWLTRPATVTWVTRNTRRAGPS